MKVKWVIYEQECAMLKWTPPNGSVQDDWGVINQIVVPQKYRDEILKLAHND